MVTITHIFVAIRQRPCGVALLVTRYFNTNLAAPEGSNRGEEIAESVATYVL